MKPTPEQLEAAAEALGNSDAPDIGSMRAGRAIASIAWDVIGPIVRAQALEEAAQECDGVRVNGGDAIDCADRIRALTSNK